MEVKDLVFFCISEGLIFLVLFGWASYVIKEYFKDVAEENEDNVLNYVGAFILISFLLELCALLVILVLALFFTISDYTLSYLPLFIKSDLFLFIFCLILATFFVVVYFISKYYSFFDIIHYRYVESKYNGVKNAQKNIEKSLKEIEKKLDCSKEDLSDKVKTELEKNKLELTKLNEAYLVKMKHLENIGVKLNSKIRENNIVLD